MDCWFSVGKAEMHCVYFAFRTTVMEQNARKVLKSLIAHGYIPSSLGYMHLPSGMPVPSSRDGNWYPFVMGIALEEDMEGILAIYVKRLKERLGYELQRLAPMAESMAQAYIDIALNRE